MTSEKDRSIVTDFIRQLDHEAEQPMGDDLRTVIWCRATKEQLMTRGSQFCPKLLQEVFSFRRETGSHFPTVYALRLSLRALQKQILKKMPGEDYAQQAVNERFWHDEVYGGLFDPVEFDVDMSYRNNQANVPDRGKAFDLVTNLFQERLGLNPVVVEVGASNNLILKKWKAKDAYPYSPTRSVTPLHGERYVGEEYEENLSETEKLQQILSLSPKLGYALGIDMFPVPQEVEKGVVNETNIWVKGCSFYPSEFLPAEGLDDRAKEFDELSAQKVSGVEYINKRAIDVRNAESLAQIAITKSDDIARGISPGGVDLFLFSNVLYEMNQADIAKTFENLRPYCHPNSLFVINEFAVPNIKETSGLSFVRQTQWRIPYNFRTIIMEPFRPDQPPREIFRWRTPRCKELMLTRYGRSLLESTDL